VASSRNAFRANADLCIFAPIGAAIAILTRESIEALPQMQEVRV